MISFPAILAWFATSRAGRAVAAVSAFAAVVWFAWVRGQSVGKDEVLDDQREDFIDRTAAGRSAGRTAERDSATMTAEERLSAVRGNDGAWE